MDRALLKTCPTCGATDGFGANKARSDGLSVYCLECNRAYHRGYYDRTLSKHRPPGDRAAYERQRLEHHGERLAKLKSPPCLDCCKAFPKPCMEFDHVRPGKRCGVGSMVTRPMEVVLAEVELCELVCCNCHRVRTDVRRPGPKLPSHALPAWKYNKAVRQLENIAAYRAEVTALKNSPCVDCGNTFHHAAMDFDHVRGEKLFCISNGWQRTREEVLAELEKCELICANCHRLRTTRRLAIAA